MHLNAKKYSEKIDTKCILLDPDSWLANQCTMSDSYEMYLDKISGLDHPINNNRFFDSSQIYYEKKYF